MEKPAAKPVATKPQPFVILSESPVQRCEMCHQSDCLSPETGVCSRCQGVDVTALEQRQTVDEAFQNILKEHPHEELYPGFLLKVAAVARVVGGLILCIIVFLFLFSLWVQFKSDHPLSVGMGFALIMMMVTPLIFARWAKRKEKTDELP